MNYSVQILKDGVPVWEWLFLTETQSQILLSELGVECLRCYDGVTGTQVLEPFQRALEAIQRDPVRYGLGELNPGGLSDILSFIDQFLTNVQTYPECTIKMDIV